MDLNPVPEWLSRYQQVCPFETKIIRFQQNEKKELSHYVSPSGFVIQPQVGSGSLKKILKMPLQKGQHIWEVIAPQDLKGIQLGIISQNGQQIHMHSFNSTTNRVITLEFNKGTLQYYLNGNLNEKKSFKNLQAETYYPYFQFGTDSKILALNPFCQHPSRGFRITNIPYFRYLDEQQNLQLTQAEILEEFGDHETIKIGQNSIIVQQDKLKLVRGQVDRILLNNPKTLFDTVIIKLSQTQFQLIKEIQFCKVDTEIQYQIEKGQVYIKVPFIVAKHIVTTKLQELEKEFQQQYKEIGLVQALQHIDEQLWAIQFQGDSQFNQQIQTTVFNHVQRITSQFQRLQTFLDTANLPYDAITLVENGLFKLPGVWTQLRHFSGQDIPLEYITQKPEVDIWKTLHRENILNVLDIPLDITINSMPYAKLNQETLIQSDQTSTWFCTVNQKGILRIWSGELALQNVAQFDLAEMENEQQEKGKVQIKEQIDSLEDKLFVFENQEGDENQDDPEEEQDIQPNQDFLNQMYQMGFSLEVSKQALIETKNASLEAAIDLVQVIVEKKKKEQSLSEQKKKKQLKLQWECLVCTFINTNENVNCAICEAKPSDSAYSFEDIITQEEIEKQKQADLEKQQKLELEQLAKKQEELRQQELRFYKEATIMSVYQLNTNHKAQTPFVLCVAFSLNRSKLQFRQVSYTPKYILQFVKEVVNDGKGEGYINNLTNTYKKEPLNHQLIAEELIENPKSRYIFETLCPVMTQITQLFDLEKGAELEFDEEIVKITQISKHIIQVHTKTQQFYVKVIDQGAFNPQIIQDQEIYLVAEKSEKQKQEELEKELQNQQIQDFNVDVTQLNSKEIEDLAKLNELQDIYFKPEYEDINSVSQIGNNNYCAQVTLLANPEVEQKVILNCRNPAKILNIQIKIYTDETKQHLDQNILNLGKINSVQSDNISQLPLTVHYHIGSQFNFQQQITKTLFINNDYFISLYQKPIFVYKHLHGKRMTLKSFSISSPIKTTPQGHNLGSGLIFVSDDCHEFNVQNIVQFRQFNRASFEQWKLTRIQDPLPLQPFEPVGYFEFEQNKDVTECILDSPVQGKYILMMSLSIRGIDQSQFESGSLALYYFIAKGCVNKEKPIQPVLSIQNPPQLFQEQQFYINKQLVTQTRSQYEVTRSAYNNQIYIQNITSQQLDDVSQLELRFKVAPKVRFIKISAQQQNLQLLKKIPYASQLSQLMHDPTQYEKFNIKLIKLIHDPTTTLEQRISAIRVLCTLQGQFEQFRQDFDCLTYIKLNVLQQDRREELCVQTFLNQLNCAELVENLQNSVKHIVINLFNNEFIIKPAGFYQLLHLLKKLTQYNPQEFFPFILQHLKWILKFIANLNDPMNDILNKAQIYNFVFEEQLFSDRYTTLTSINIKENNEVKAQFGQQIQQQQQNKSQDQIIVEKVIPQIIKHSESYHHEKFQIDLLTEYDLHKLNLVFANHAQAPRYLRIQLWAENVLILDESYYEHITTLFTKLAEQFKAQIPKSKLNIMKFDIDVRKVRYLQMTVSYSHNLNVKTKEEIQTTPKSLLLLPEFKGRIVNQDAVYQSNLSVNYQKKPVLQLNNSQSYSAYTLDDQTIYDSSSTFETEKLFKIVHLKGKNEDERDKSKEIEFLKDSLQKAQRKLRDKIQKGFGQITRDEILEQVSTIKTIQLELARIESLPEKNFQKSLDFLNTLAYEFIDILIQTDKTNKAWRQQSTLQDKEGLNLAKLLFNSFVNKDQGPITELTTQLLNILLDNLNLQSWIAFSFQQYANLDQVSLVSLQKLDIPLSQTILYIRNNLTNTANIQHLTILLQLVTYKLQIKISNQETSRFSPKEFSTEQVQQSSLKPLGTIRSTSSQEQDINQEFLQECYNVNKTKVYHATFNILMWVLQQYNLQDTQKLFDLSCQLFLMMENEDQYKFVKDICKLEEPHVSEIAQLITNSVILNQQQIKKQLMNVLDKFTDNNPEAQRMIYYTLQQLLQSVVEYAFQPNDLKLKIDTDQWIEYVTYLANYLILNQHKIKRTEPDKEKQDKVQRKKSQIKQIQTTYSFQNFVEIVEESGYTMICLPETFQLLLNCLEENPKNIQSLYPLRQSLNFWGLFMNITLKQRIPYLVEQRLFDRIIDIYLKQDAQIQQTIWPRITQLTKNTLESIQQTDINSFILKQILDKQTNPVIQSFLQVLSSKERKLNQNIIKRLFEEVATYLIKNCNFGRNDGVLHSDLDILRRLQRVDKLLTVLIKSECSVKIQIVIQEIPDYQKSLSTIIHWYMLNRYFGQSQSPAQDLLINISKQIKEIFVWIASDVTLATSAIILLYKLQAEIDSVLNQLSGNLHYQLVKSTQEIFEELNELWMISDQVVREVAIKANGFEYLLEKTHLTTQYQKQKDNPEPQEEEVGNKMVLFEPDGTQSSVTIKDWQGHKKGVKTKLHTVMMKDNNYDEFSLDFQLDKQVELKLIRIGFQVYTAEQNDKVYGFPSSVIVEVKNNQWYPIGSMVPVDDEAYSNYTVRVMALNLYRINSQSEDLNTQIRNLKQQPISWIRFIIRRPQVTYLEGISLLQFKQYNQIQIAVNFISIVGYDANFNLSVRSIQENTSSKLLGKMCTSKFRNTLQDISNNSKIIEQIKKNFQNVSQALQKNESTLSPLFIGLTKYNPLFGDWILEQLFDIRYDNAHAKLCAEIVLQDISRQSERINKFSQFVFSLLKSIESISQSQQSLTQLSSFIESLTYSLYIAAKQNKNQINTNITQGEVQIILNAIHLTQQYQQANMIIKLLVTLGQNKNLVTYLFEQYVLNKQHYLLRILSALVQVENNFDHSFLKIVFDDAFAALQNNDTTSIQDYFFFLDSSANIISINEYYRNNKYHQKIYEGLKNNNNQSLLRTVDLATLPYIVSFIGKCTIKSQESIESFASSLIQDIKLLSQIVDINYVEQVLMPLLNYEEKTEFTIDLWDKEGQTFVGDIRKLSSKFNEQEEDVIELTTTYNNLNGFQDKEFTKIQFDALQGAISKVVKSNSLKKGGVWIKEVEITSSKQQFSSLLASLQKGPFIVVIHGKNGNSGDPCIIGLFSTQAAGSLVNDFQHEYYPNEVYPIPENGEQFAFAYEKDRIYHLLNPDLKAFGVCIEYENEKGACSFISERINITLNEEQSEICSVSIGIHDFELLEPKPEEDYYFDDFWFQKVEIWSYKSPQSAKISNKSQMLGQLSLKEIGHGILSSSVLQDKYLMKTSVFNYFSPTPIYVLPSTCTSQQVLQAIRVSTLSLNKFTIPLFEGTIGELKKNPYVLLQLDGLELLSQLNASNENQFQYNPKLKIFDSFQQQDGVKQIIMAVTNAIQTWNNKELANKWSQYISELNSFCSVPQFFSCYLENKQSELLFQLLAGVPDQPNVDQNLWIEQEASAVKYIYDTLSNVFKSNNNQELRIIAINDKLIQRILDRIAIVAKEKKRVYHEQIDNEEEIKDQVQDLKRKESKGKTKNKPQKKQGVGYGSDQTGQNQKWNTQEYLDKKKSRSEQLRSLLDIIKNFFNYDGWQMSQELAKEINNMIFESALLPMLEAAFRSGSLLEMSKDSELNQAYLGLTKTISKHKLLAPLLMKIPPNYLPRQIESIADLLTNLRSVANVFISCLNTEVLSEKDQISKQIAQAILDTHESVHDQIERYEHQGKDFEDYEQNKEAEIQKILKLPLQNAYRALLQDLRFDYVSFKNCTGVYQHFYERYISQAAQPSSVKLIRLAQEFADMSNSLPIEHTNSIFVRADKERVDVMKAMIMGASGTPYAHGAYVFDIYFDEGYPMNPPKMNLSTTGGGKIRFNPNLYSCGKVCLSLLGTWRGHASENWDPRLSTLLQVLVSTQAIIMSEDVYYNEPGFEGEAGTAEGDAKNEAYCNIVKYGNIMYAMIDNIKNPPEGFENVIKRHFYLKKAEILEEVNKWLQEAKTASYVGLVSDHNSTWCSTFKKTPQAFTNMLKDAIQELETTLNSIPAPTAKDIVTKISQKSKRKVAKQQDNGLLNIDEVDVKFDQKEQKQLELDVNSENFKDRWSRYIGAMGMDAVSKQAQAKVVIVGLGQLGIEVAKNVVLSGVKVLALWDTKIVTQDDLIGHFFLQKEDIGKEIAEACLDKIQQLNNYVRVINVKQQDYLIQEKFDLVVLTNIHQESQILQWGKFCRENKIKIIITNVDGVYARIVNDFGAQFTILDKNGEELPEVMIKNISNEENGKVELLQGQKSLFEDGDFVLIDHVEGMIDEIGNSINKTIHKIKTINFSSFQIENTTGYTAYIRNGTAKHVKKPIIIDFKPVEQILANYDNLDQNMQISDFMKLNSNHFLHLAYKIWGSLEENEQVIPTKESISKLIEKYGSFAESATIKDNQDHLLHYLYIFFATIQQISFPPLVAYIGGFVSQEAIKALTNKFTPINQIYYSDCVEVLPYPLFDPKEQSILEEYVPKSKSLENLLGSDLTAKIHQSKVFMVGCGAIGCELLKNFAMIDLGINGQLTITDPDHIETSNLNRQFLFREKHIHKSKSQIAAASAIQMNSNLKNKIIARQDKVFEQSEHIFTNQFFEGLTLVANALDNVQARRYVDRRCVKAQVPLLESGTLGPKGHVQCIIPFQTESYGSQNDPVEEGDIPYCTLKMFPEETFHCVEFARDKFSKLFCIKPKILINILENSNYNPQNAEDLKQLRESIKILRNAPKNFGDCIEWARKKYQKYFVNDIKQLLYTYPLDHKNKDGNPFWTLPKRPPQVLEFDNLNQIHTAFISTLSHLRAYMFQIQGPDNWREQEQRYKISEKASAIVLPDWVPNDAKRDQIEKQVVKENDKQQEEAEDQVVTEEGERETLLKELVEYQKQKPKIISQEFEKDQDNNGHIDFIHSFGNLRAFNYKLDEMDWLTVKIKAGRIVPALATTTAAIAGLQTIELVKILKNINLEQMKNAFLNIAIPILSLTEPGPPQKIKLSEKVTVTLWDRWDIEGYELTLQNLFDQLREQYDLEPANLFYKSAPIYSDLNKNEQAKQQLLATKLQDLLQTEDNYADVVINFVKNGEIVKDVPEVRIQLKKK